MLISVLTASNEAKEAAKRWIAKLQIKNGSYPPDANPNPGSPSLPCSNGV